MHRIVDGTSSEPSAASRRLLGLPSVARLALFARHPGPALLLTTRERLQLFDHTAPFGALRTVNPFLDDWRQRHDKVVVDIEQALRPFPDDPDAFLLDLVLGSGYPREALLEQLLRFGYERDALPGFSVRGDTVDLFPGDDPGEFVRLTFFGDELDSLVVAGEARDRFILAPLPGAELEEETWTSRLLEKLPGTVFLDGAELFPGVLGEEASGRLWALLEAREVVSFGRDPLPLAAGSAPLAPLGYYRGRLGSFAADLEGWLRAGYRVTLLLKFERSGRYLREKVLEHLDVDWGSRVGARSGLTLVLAPHAAGGYKDDEAREIVLTEELLYGYQGSRKLPKLPGRRVQDAAQLSLGDYLIHPDHGIGRFLGLEPRTVVGTTRDYLILQYAGEGKLYLPVEQLPLLRRHPGTTDDPPRLSTLGTNEWARARDRARVNAQELAVKLLRTYAERQLSQGEALPPLPDWDPLIEENCSFTLTPDQQKAVEAALRDMARQVPMDRLISGDVGFGKTEVAIRTAHRAIGNGKQVAVLVPTTVLAKQHFETFRERFAGLPVTVEMLSRFTPERETGRILEGLAAGAVDIVIGTHRLLNEAVRFKALGLLVIDEEHRFGVAQKERMKALRANLDILSLSATPIPRSLYMSMVGLRDVSQILTPPEGRKPIQTVLQPYDAMAVREAALFELERGGKTYYIHDRIGSIGLRARTLEHLLPEVRIGVAHGRMDAEALEEVMLRFQEGGYDLLLSTTIVESGLDISGANTLIIERADKLGLAQLYQLRGRVGRRETEAWAYLFYPGRLTEQAQRRLYAIAELNDLGSGHLLAERDMEIRGVGNLLGAEQHGHISAVSLEVYTELLAEEIARLKGEVPGEERPAVAIDLSLDARLSPVYIQDDEERIAFYGRLAEARQLAEVSRIAKEMRERFGPFPPEVDVFVELTRLRLLAGGKGVVSIKEHMTDIQLSFAADHQQLDFDSKGIRSLPFAVEPTRYPPGFSLRKRGLGGKQLLDAVTRILYLCG